MITVKQKGDFLKTEVFLKGITEKNYLKVLRKYGEQGVQALSAATPVESGKTASSWSYEIIDENGSYSIIWHNSNIQKGVNIAILIQYGHGTRNGGYVEGIDYINPALRSIFEDMADAAWKEVTA